MLRPTTSTSGSDRVQGLMALLKDKSSPYALHWDDDESMLLSVARLVTIIESDAPNNIHVNHILSPLGSGSRHGAAVVRTCPTAGMGRRWRLHSSESMPHTVWCRGYRLMRGWNLCAGSRYDNIVPKHLPGGSPGGPL